MLRRPKTFKMAGFLSLELCAVLFLWVTYNRGWHNLDCYDPVAGIFTLAIVACSFFWAVGHVLRHIRHHRKAG